ncbi:MAG: single-stranded-DNA-specific exonuclease RecJ [Chloroflexi bacterium]|nr:single-stranded-DNA-specific exonuclease RecJ [Chloroflexota bacterium]
MLSKKWVLKPASPPGHLKQYQRYNIGPELAQVLINRGFDSPELARDFLRAADLSGGRYLNIKGKTRPIDRAVSRLVNAIKGREKIVVYGDFDADGVTSTVLLVQALRSLGADVEPYIPNRIDEGYGLNNEALESLAKEGVRVVVTVDCGIRSIEEVKFGNSQGLDLIVTDHHSIGPELPQAYAVINPKDVGWSYAEDMLAGVGVAYRVVEALLMVAGHNRKLREKRQPLELESLLDLVAIGTVADLAPLNRIENRALVQRGLELINQKPRPGIKALLEVAGVKPGSVTAMTIGYAIGPRINAAGRLDSAMIAYNLLAAKDEAEGKQWAERLQDLNLRRQDLTRAAQEKIRAKIEVETKRDLPLIFAGDRDFQPGIVGLVAGRLVEEYFRPAVVMELGETESRASCRSIPQFDITRALDQCADMLVRHGGHAQAAGFTVLNGNIDRLKERLMALAESGLAGQELRPMLEVDVDVPLDRLSEGLVMELQQLEPTGHMNPAPVLMSRRLRVVEARTVGKDSSHLKLKVTDEHREGRVIDAIGFGLGEWTENMPGLIDVAYQLEINIWNGSRSLQLNLQDIRPAEQPE